MFQNLLGNRKKFFYRLCSGFLILILAFNFALPPGLVYAQLIQSPMVRLPAVGTLVNASEKYTPLLLQGIVLDPQNPLKLKFIVDTGDSGLAGEALNQEALKVIKYFFAALTVPQDDMWVNLSPYEGDKMIPEIFGQTEMGRDMLAQDYILKQLTASLMFPDEKTGKEFWTRVYTRAQELYGTTQLPFNTFNKIWITPKSATIYENAQGALATDERMEIMLERDYLSLAENADNPRFGMNGVSVADLNETEELTQQMVREVLIPEVEREVNEGKHFANLRQIYSALVLASWFKQALKDSLLDQIYVDKNKIAGVNLEDKTENAKIYQQYLEAFQKGAYDLIKEEHDPATNETVLRKYYSGGFANKEIAGPGGVAKRLPMSSLNSSPVQGRIIEVTTAINEVGNKADLNKFQASIQGTPTDASSPLVEEVKASSARRILLVDDSESIRRLFQILLTREGFEVFTAKSKDDALKVISEVGLLDVVITDLEMPGGSGIDLARAMNQNPNLNKIPIILSSAANFNLEQFRASGNINIQAFVPKGRSAELIQQVTRLTAASPISLVETIKREWEAYFVSLGSGYDSRKALTRELLNVYEKDYISDREIPFLMNELSGMIQGYRKVKTLAESQTGIEKILAGINEIYDAKGSSLAAKQGSFEAFKEILETVRSIPPSVASSAVGSEDNVKDLIERLMSGNFEESDRIAMIIELGSMGGPEVVTALRGIINNPKETQLVRAEAQISLDQMESEVASSPVQLTSDQFDNNKRNLDKVFKEINGDLINPYDEDNSFLKPRDIGSSIQYYIGLMSRIVDGVHRPFRLADLNLTDKDFKDARQSSDLFFGTAGFDTLQTNYGIDAAEVFEFVGYKDVQSEMRGNFGSSSYQVVLNIMDAGLGSNVGRTLWNLSNGRTSEGAKATDLGIKMNVNGQQRFVSIAEMKLLRLIGEIQKQNEQGLLVDDKHQLFFEAIVSNDSWPSYQKLFNQKRIIKDPEGLWVESSKTYREIFDNLGIDISQFYVPFYPRLEMQPPYHLVSQKGSGSHGEVGFKFLSWLLNSPDMTGQRDRVRVFYNGDGVNNIPTRPMIEWALNHNVPITMITTEKIGVDKKGGMLGIRILQDGTFEVAIMELAEAKMAGQVSEFQRTGLEGQEKGKQLFNTNMAILNENLLSGILKGIYNEILNGNIEEFSKLIAPNVIQSVKNGAIQIEGPVGTVFINLHNYVEKTKRRDDAIGQIMRNILIRNEVVENGDAGKILQFINVDAQDRSEVFTPVKTPIDFWTHFYSRGLYEFNNDSWMLDAVNLKQAQNMPEFDLSAPALTQGKSDYYIDDDGVTHVIETLGNANISYLDSLKIRGLVRIPDATLIGNVSIINETNAMFDFETLDVNQLPSNIAVTPSVAGATGAVSRNSEGKLVFFDVTVTISSSSPLTPVQRVEELMKHFESTPLRPVDILNYNQTIRDFVAYVNSLSSKQSQVEFIRLLQEKRNQSPIPIWGKIDEVLTNLNSEEILRITEPTVAGSIEPKEKGGIDFNPEFLDLQIKRDGNGVPLPIDRQPVQWIQRQIQGIVPVIINVAPVTNLPMLLGVTSSAEDTNPLTKTYPQSPGRDPQDLLLAALGT